MHPVAIDDNNAADLMVISTEQDIDHDAEHGQITRLFGPKPSYEACLNSNETPSPMHSGKGAAGCFIGHGTVAGFTVLDATPDAVRFEITVWEGEGR